MADFKCDRCQRDIDFDDVGFLGDPTGSQECSGFTRLTCLCHACFEEDPGFLDDEKAPSARL